MKDVAVGNQIIDEAKLGQQTDANVLISRISTAFLGRIKIFIHKFFHEINDSPIIVFHIYVTLYKLHF